MNRPVSAALALLLATARAPTQQPEDKSMELKGSKTEQNLKDAFAGESMASRR